MLEPVDWAMVLSLRPTFRWETVDGATSYRIHLHRSTNTFLIGEELMPVVGVGA